MPMLPLKLRDKSRVLAKGERYNPEVAARELSRNSRPALKLIKRLFRNKEKKGKGKDEIAFVKDTILGMCVRCVWV